MIRYICVYLLFFTVQLLFKYSSSYLLERKCKENKDCFTFLNEVCLDNKCGCKDDYVQVNYYCLYKYPKLGATCYFPEECMSQYTLLYCKRSFCRCRSNYKWNANTSNCVYELGYKDNRWEHGKQEFTSFIENSSYDDEFDTYGKWNVSPTVIGVFVGMTLLSCCFFMLKCAAKSHKTGRYNADPTQRRCTMDPTQQRYTADPTQGRYTTDLTQPTNQMSGFHNTSPNFTTLTTNPTALDNHRPCSDSPPPYPGLKDAPVVLQQNSALSDSFLPPPSYDEAMKHQQI